MKVEILESLDVFCTEYSVRGPSGVWMLTARPLKQGMLRSAAHSRERSIQTKFVEGDRCGVFEVDL